jgi:hypothetical protein
MKLTYPSLRPIKIMRFVVLFMFSILTLSMIQDDPLATFVIKDKAAVTDVNRYTTALNNANMEAYRLLDKRSVLVFEPQKVVVELLSARELVALGKKIDPANYPATFPATFEMPVFSISAGGWLMARYSNDKSKFH